MTSEITKKCTKCLEFKNIDCFKSNGYGTLKDGTKVQRKKASCDVCRVGQNAKYYEKTKITRKEEFDKPDNKAARAIKYRESQEPGHSHHNNKCGCTRKNKMALQ